MAATPWKLVPRNLTAHWVRSGLTVLSVGIALMLLCVLNTVVTTLDRAVNEAATNRLVVQSAVSLFVNLPLDYQAKIESVPGVRATTKFQWFGGAYQDDDQFFAQFGVDHERFLDLYEDELEILEVADVPVETDADADEEPTLLEKAHAALATDRRACLIGEDLATGFGWKVGDQVPILGRIFSKPDGSAWEFVVVGIYKPRKANVDGRTLYFRWDYLEENLRAAGAEDIGTGVFMVEIEPGASPEVVTEEIDALFASGPQRTQTTTEAAFQALFVNMLGKVPQLMATIGGAVVFALFFSVINTMSMAARQRQHDAGILKALGFTNAAISRVFYLESLLLCVLGGALGLGLAVLTSEPIRGLLGSNLPGYEVLGSTLAAGAGVSVLVGLLAGIAPAVSASRTSPVDALRSEG